MADPVIDGHLPRPDSAPFPDRHEVPVPDLVFHGELIGACRVPHITDARDVSELGAPGQLSRGGGALLEPLPSRNGRWPEQDGVRGEVLEEGRAHSPGEGSVREGQLGLDERAERLR